MTNQSDTTSTAPIHPVSEYELNAEILRHQEQIKRFKTLSIAGIALGIALCVLGVAAPGFIILILGGCLLIPKTSHQKQLKELVAGNIIRQALEEIFDDITYDPSGYISESTIRSSRVSLPDFVYIHGSDHVTGTYKGLNIEMSDVTLVDEDITTDEHGNTERNNRTVFRGLWLICDFGKELSADLRLWERGKLGKMFGGRGIQTDNDQFNKHFCVQSEIEHEAFYILTPRMMDRILEMDQNAGGVTRMHFARDGRVQIVIESGRDSFEIGKNETDAAALREKFLRTIRCVTDIIDELCLVDTLYKQ